MQNPESNIPPNSPPDNPYQAPNSPPPFNTPSAPTSPVAPAPMPGAVTTDVIGQAWDLLKPQLGMWVVAMLIYFAISGTFRGVSTVIHAASGNNPSTALSFISFVILVAGFLVGLLIGAGLIKMAIHHVRSGQADIAKIFDITDVIAPILIAGILVTIATAVGLVLCVIPGFIIAFGFSMYTPLIVDQKADAMDSIKRSWEACKPHLGALFLLFLVLGLINLAGLCACGLGLFITFPLTQIAIALTYRNLFGVGRSESGVAPSPFPPPPIASPQ